jgi:hypothetical protein
MCSSSTTWYTAEKRGERREKGEREWRESGEGEGEKEIAGEWVHLRIYICFPYQVMSGQTLLECKKVLLSRGAQRVSCYVTHAVFPKESWRRFCPDADPNPFHRFFVTDSVASVSDRLMGSDPFEVLSLVDSIGQNILRYNHF